MASGPGEATKNSTRQTIPLIQGREERRQGAPQQPFLILRTELQMRVCSLRMMCKYFFLEVALSWFVFIKGEFFPCCLSFEYKWDDELFGKG